MNVYLWPASILLTSGSPSNLALPVMIQSLNVLANRGQKCKWQSSLYCVDAYTCMVVMIKRQSPACTTLACNVQFFLWEKLVVSMQCVHRVLACSGVMVMAIVMVIGSFHCDLFFRL